jgi:pimeloyl-ACP methyl ester carboxylesterase
MSYQMYYRKTGSGPALVLLHGFPDSGAIWHHVAAQLSASYTVLAPDLPGSGYSPLPHPMLLPEMATHIAQMLRTEGFDNAVIAGHSMGGYTALAFAAEYTHMVRGLSLIHSTATADDPEKTATRLKAMELIQNGGKEMFVKQMTANLFADSFKAAHPLLVKHKTDTGMELSTEGMLNFYKAITARPDHTGTIAAATYPVQWIIGEKDNIINFTKNLSECHNCPINFVALYTDCGHISTIERSAQLIADLSTFSGYCYQLHPETE